MNTITDKKKVISFMLKTLPVTFKVNYFTLSFKYDKNKINLVKTFFFVQKKS